ncbi:MerR family transcriptional regulator [Streptomyces fumigatiscleroticus]|nr:MerR family transcriptional regulator [Streptomyces fumigatiscleroticus]
MVLQIPGALVPYGTKAPRRVPQSEVQMTADTPLDRIDDDYYPAYTMGRAAEMLGTTRAFLRALGEARLITPLRSGGGHRRYSRQQLRIAARARALVDQGTAVNAACRIIILEDQLQEARHSNDALRCGDAGSSRKSDA